jgi:hypothetical protein
MGREEAKIFCRNVKKNPCVHMKEERAYLRSNGGVGMRKECLNSASREGEKTEDLVTVCILKNWVCKAGLETGKG